MLVQQRKELPGPTTDLELAKQQLLEFGYCVIENALSPSEVKALKDRLTDQAAGERERGRAYLDGGKASMNQRVWMLVNKGKIFRDLMLHPLVDSMMGDLLGPKALLSSLTANIAGPGGEAMFLHQDQGYVGFWTPVPLVANMAWMLDDFTSENGGTRLIPGSHLDASYILPTSSSQSLPPGTRIPTQDDTIAAEGKAGSVLCFDGRLWHGTGANTTESDLRRGLLSYHCRPFIRQQENFLRGLRPEILQSERPALLKRLGFAMWGGLGRIESPFEKGFVQDGPALMGPLCADGTPIPDTDQGKSVLQAGQFP
ncbi:MAG: phytanoyl-CoA dioxygenase family protein [Pirellulaceae bacterium]|nr:phytanoyl-CoA dioxygenase family protein [Pirellulaceae bacterium]